MVHHAKFFDSIEAMADYAATVPAQQFLVDHWSGGMPLEEQRRLLRSGCTAGLVKAEALLGRMETECSIESLAPEWTRSVVGSSPSVPSYLCGAPNAMHRMEHSGEQGPIRVWACIGGSSGFSADVFREQGVRILATVLSLSRVRPVELWAYCSTTFNSGEEITLGARVGTHPVDLSLATMALAEPWFARSITYGCMYQVGGRLRFVNDNLGSPKRPLKQVLKSLGVAEDSDVVIERIDTRSHNTEAARLKLIQDSLAEAKCELTFIGA